MAKPIYTVMVTFDIGSYKGDWTGQEEQMERQYAFLYNGPSRDAAESVYKRIASLENGKRRSPFEQVSPSQEGLKR